MTMVQRTPSYIAGRPEQDTIAADLQAILPASVSHPILRWRAALMQLAMYKVMQRFPGWAKELLLKRAREEVGEVMSDVEFEKAFTPPYNPWDQRLCLSPASDFYGCLHQRTASIVTGHIKTFTESGIEMEDGTVVDADMIITATGLTMQRNFPMSTMAVTIDGEAYSVRSKFIYKGAMLSEVPNFAFVVGYTNASWTLKVDIVCMFVSRLLNKMRAEGIAYCVPRSETAKIDEGDFMNLSSGYIQRAKEHMPNQGTRHPWRPVNNYLRDYIRIGWGSLNDPVLACIPAAAAGAAGLAKVPHSRL